MRTRLGVNLRLKGIPCVVTPGSYVYIFVSATDSNSPKVLKDDGGDVKVGEIV